jgi:hypothetical protein
MGNTAAAPALLGEHSRYEYREVTTSERKMDETQRETVLSVVADVAKFLTLVARYYTPDDAAQYGDALYGAMNSAGGKMPGLGPADTYPFSQLHSVTSAQSFYTYNVSQFWKELIAELLRVDWENPEVLEVWKDTVTNGQDMDPDMLELDSTGLRADGWLSPDDRMAVPTASSREQGTGDFFSMCHIVSLAPEWYPDGLVRLNPSPIPACIRPVSFDGMTSPLWVQRPPDQHAATGGDALETHTQNAIPLDTCLPLQSYIVTNDMTLALQASPSVNFYAVDLALVASGGTPANQLLGNEQRSIVAEVRRARTAADLGFEKLGKGSAITSTPPGASDSRQSAMPNNALPRKRSYQSIEDLKEQMEAWAQAGLVEHRGQRFSAERFEREAEASPERATEIATAAAELLNESTDSRVLQMVAQLARHSGYAPYYDALLRRLETGDVPDGAGLRSRTLREDLLKRLADVLPATDENLAARAHGVLKKEGRANIRLALLNQFDPAGETVDVLAEVCRGEADPSLVALTAARLSRSAPALLLRAAAIVAGQKERTRGLFYQEIQRAAPGWAAQHGEDLKSLLRLS